MFKYSLEEHIVGTWVDDRPIYSKTIYVPALPSNDTEVKYDNGISDIDYCWFNTQGCFVFGWGSSHQTECFPYLNYTGAHLYLLDCNPTFFKIKTTRNRSDLSAYVTLLYVKTTDIK